MKNTFLLTTLLTLGFNIFPVMACQPGNPQDIKYIRRDNNRCEGIKPQEVSRGFRLISFATRGITNYANTLNLFIPRVGSSQPNVIVQSLDNNYILDRLSLVLNQSRFRFSFKPDVLKKANVPPKTLRAVASVYINSQTVYVPVTIEKSSGQYEFVLYTSERAKFPLFEILSNNNKVIYKTSRNNAQNGEIIFNWDGRTTPAGRYQVHYIAEQERIGRPSEKIERRFYFEHNPNWLR